MPEWFVEEGIGEHRAILVEGDAIVAAQVEWPGALAASQVEDALLVARTAGSARGTVRFAGGEEALIDTLPRDAAEGARLRALVTRAAIAEAGRCKRAQARPTQQPVRPAPTLAERLTAQAAGAGASVRLVARFPVPGWDELVAEALDGTIAFAHGSLSITPTPAMTLIDVDGTLSAPALALAAVPALAGAIRRLELGGSIGIDFPTLKSRAERRALDEALGHALAGWPHERTAVNGFGFVQLVARLERPSLVQRARNDPAGLAARLLLRRAEAVREPGTLLVSAHPTVVRACTGPWREALARRTGRVLRWHEDAGLALLGGFAQALTS